MDKDQEKPKSEQLPGTAQDPPISVIDAVSSHDEHRRFQGTLRMGLNYRSPPSNPQKRP
jgi:hypothetical protein